MHGIDIIFGSVIVWIILQKVGLSGNDDAAVAGSYNFILLWHPYALTSSPQRSVVGLCYRPEKATSSSMIWLFGCSSACHCARFLPLWLGIGEVVALIVSKQAINGCLNTLIAGIILIIGMQHKKRTQTIFTTTRLQFFPRAPKLHRSNCLPIIVWQGNGEITRQETLEASLLQQNN